MTSPFEARRRRPALTLAVLSLLVAVASPALASAAAPGASEPPASAASAPDAAPRVNVNLAGAAQLQVLPQVGPVVAQRIIDYRTAVGPFRKVEELLNVKGIGRKTLDRLRPLITLGEPGEEAETAASSDRR